MTLLARLPLHPLLFAAYAVLYLYAENLDQVLPVDVAAPLARAILGAAAALAAFTVLYWSPRRGALVASAVVVAFFAYGHVAGLVADLDVDDGVQLGAWGVLILVAAVYAARSRATLPHATTGLNIVALVLVVMTAATIVPYEVQRAGGSPVAAAGVVPVRAETDAMKRDIYFLVFDRYGSADALERRFGITDNDLYGWLEERGFQVPADSRANYRATDFSLAATLNMRTLDHLTAEIGRVSSDRTPAKRMVHGNEVGRFLKTLGYTYYQLGSWFDVTNASEVADEVLTFDSTSEFEAVLRDTTVLPAIDRLTGTEAKEPTFRDRHREGSLFAFRQIRRLATAPGPKFIFAHILLPHDPYVFHADGSVVTEEEERSTDEVILYREHLAFLNGQIRSLVDQLQSGPEDRRPIIILEGDEGPLACQNVDCVQRTPEYYATRFRNLIAMYLPGIDHRLPETYTSVNTFRTVFREYFGADLPPLPDRSYTWPDNDHIYDFEDITDEIAPLLHPPGE